jgi:AcrR family transcriptional regulator
MGVEPQDRRVRRTRRALQEALRELMQEKAYDRITVQDVLDRADVGRATFYAHFRDKDALLMSEFEAMRESLRQHLATFLRAREHGSDGRRHPGLGVARAVFNHAAEWHQQYRALVRSRSGGAILRFAHQELTSLIEEHLSEAVAQGRHRPMVPVKVTAQYVAGALLAMLTWWVSHDVPYAAEEMAGMFARMTIPAVAGSLGVEPHTHEHP